MNKLVESMLACNVVIEYIQ